MNLYKKKYANNCEKGLKRYIKCMGFSCNNRIV